MSPRYLMRNDRNVFESKATENWIGLHYIHFSRPQAPQTGTANNPSRQVKMRGVHVPHLDRMLGSTAFREISKSNDPLAVKVETREGSLGYVVSDKLG